MQTDQHELYEYARKRIQQKKQLYYHFIFFCLGSIFMYVANNWLDFYSVLKWWKWSVILWVLIFIFHFINVFVTNRFMDKKWERTQIDKLILKQTKKIEQLKDDLDNSNPSL